MRLPELGDVDLFHERILLDVSDYVRDAGAGVGHEEHAAHVAAEVGAEEEHGEGDAEAEEFVDDFVGVEVEEGEEEEGGRAT